MTPSGRTLKLLRDQGHIAQSVEQWVPKTFIRRDLFGFIDIIAIRDRDLVGIQVTSGSNHANRVMKALKSPILTRWLKTGALFEVHSWSKRVSYNKDGGKAKVSKWTLRVQPITQ